MIKELDEIRAEVEKHPDEGRDLDKARALADAYVAAHPDEFAEFAGMDIPAVVKMIDVFRAAELLDSQWRAEAWHLHRFPPQQIGGNVKPQTRVPGTTYGN